MYPKPQIASNSLRFIQSLAGHLPGEYTFCAGGQVSLYASAYAAMALHFINRLDIISEPDRYEWQNYINSWQDPQTGYFLGPELAPDQFTRPDMDATYARLHLLIHVLPALELLGGKPTYPLKFARNFADPDYLRAWLGKREWNNAWLEGNNLLFAGQLLVYLRDQEGYAPADAALGLYFDWLDAEQDPTTGLWGTNASSDVYQALYGAYHQLLVYYACDRPVRHAMRIIDTVLNLQQLDGSFSRTPGGGACEDVDAVDVLVNLMKRTGYRIEDVHQALAATIPHILGQQAPRGGFVYRWGRSYMQSGVLRTFVAANQPDIFSTWFRLHTLALINEVVKAPILDEVEWRFNPSCSMGWHDQAVQVETLPMAAADTVEFDSGSTRSNALNTIPLKKRLVNPIYALLRRLPAEVMARVLCATLPRYLRLLPLEDSLAALIEIEQTLDRLGREKSYELAGGLDVAYWWSQAPRFYLNHLKGSCNVVHLGCGSGSLSFTLASQSNAEIVATDADVGQVEIARSSFRHPRLTFVDATELPCQVMRPNVIIVTDLTTSGPAWGRWSKLWRAWTGIMVLAQFTAFPRRWNELSSSITEGLMTSASSATIKHLAPTGWDILESVNVYGALHARLISHDARRLEEGQEP